jgi:hypothetical protein
MSDNLESITMKIKDIPRAVMWVTVKSSEVKALRSRFTAEDPVSRRLTSKLVRVRRNYRRLGIRKRRGHYWLMKWVALETKLARRFYTYCEYEIELPRP